jgi:acyl-CoA dehydrogenase
MGFIKRMLDEAISHCKKRMVGAGNLLSLDQVSYMLSRIQSAYTLCAAMCVRSSDISGMERNLAADGLEANAIKAVVTDVMQESAQILVQVSGGNGYRISNIGGRGIMDSRPFQIFEGSNEMLYAQIGETLTRLMKKQQQLNLFDFLKGFHLTARSCFLFKTELSFMLQNVLPQRKLHDLGKIVGRVMSMEYVIEIGERGFRKDLVNNCIAIVQQEVAALTSSFRNSSELKIVEDYAANSSWLQFA